MIHLTDEQREEGYSIARSKWIENGFRRRRTVKAIKAELAMRGWEEIAIEILFKYLIPMLWEWWKNRNQEPAMAMPYGFGCGPFPELDHVFLMDEEDDE